MHASLGNFHRGTKLLNLANRNITPSSIIPWVPNVGTALIAALWSVFIVKFLYGPLIYLSQLVLTCGTENALLTVAELEKCEYQITGTTPALCRWKTNTRKMNYEPFKVRYLGTRVYVVQLNGIDALLLPLSRAPD